MQGGVAIAGATGLIGTTLAAACARDGIPVSALVRDTARGAERLPSATLHAWDATRGSPPAGAFDGVDVVVNLVGEALADKRWSDARKKQLRDSRVVATRALVDAMRDLPKRPRLLISASGVGYYGNRGDEILTESASAGTGFVAELVRDWEAEAMRAADIGLRVVVMRSGVVLSKDAGILRKLLPPFRMGLGGPIGGGGQWLPWIHLEDEIGLFRHAMSHEAVTGPLNAVAPEPVTNGEFARALGEALGRPTVLKAPAFALRLRFGSLVDEVLLASQRVMPVRTLETGYAFRHPLLREAMAEVLAKRPRETEPAATTT
ncbi:MAG TPA: TIGR01777 family oxidoreductase [Polyangia bacterium]|nr:TIGR01777 family oxidoreductase [Polyangia bacterium]